MKSSDSLVTMILRLILGGIFIYAGVVKIAAPVAFAGSVAAYKILPYFGNYLVASILPWLELLCGLMLVTGYKYRSAAMLVFILSLVFMGALLSVIFRGLDIDCGCFRQGGGKTSAWTALARDIGCMLVAVYLSRSREGGR